jgi:putative endopeptidase
MKLTYFICFCSIIAFGCNSSDSKKPDLVPLKDALVDNIDTSISAADDFFIFSNGRWIKNNPIPGEESSWGIGNLVVNENLDRLKIINEDAAKEIAEKGSPTQKIGDFWKAAMDSSSIEKEGLSALKPYLNKIDSINNVPALISVSADLNRIGVSSLFADYIGQDDKNSEVMSYKLWQGGIGLPEREYYFNKDSSTEHIRKQYLAYIKIILRLQGQDSIAAASSANAIMQLETTLAKSSRKLADLRDPYTNYNKMAIRDLDKLTPSINWPGFLNAIQVKNIDSVIIGQPEFFKTLNTVLNSTSINDWKNYLRFRLIRTYAFALPDAFGVTTFNFSKLLSGADERKPRWKRVLDAEEEAMGELLGQLYVKEFFNEKTKKRYEDLVESIRTVYKDRIKNLTWMSDSTKQKAYLKLAAIKKKVGYPDKWKDFSTMQISKESYVQNMINANLWWHNRETNKLGKPVDRDEWEMTPQTYNAYYNPSNNEIVLPAGIFTVPGKRDEELDDATVYGYAGASTIGHEITHGFDDEGRQFDDKGNLRSWWTKKDEVEFKKRANVMIKQFDSYEPIRGFKINGKATLGENIADLGGILLGLDAFKKTEQYKKGEMIGGYTPLERYFMGYSLGWLGHTRNENLKNQLMTDVHSPAQFRVNGPFADVDEFYKTFNVKEGNKMYIPDSLRVKIW